MLFGSSGIRGIFGKELTCELALRVGLALGTVSKSERILIGRDVRFSGELLEKTFSAGIVAAGKEAVLCGPAPTPSIAYLGSSKNTESVSLTASHNPAEYNGIKIFDRFGVEFVGKKAERIEKLVEKGGFYRAGIRGLGKFVEKPSEAVSAHRKAIVSRLPRAEKSLRIVVDCANSVGSLVTPWVLENMGFEVFAYNSEMDGGFPGREPEPNEKTLRNTCEYVKEKKADIGFAHDPDADRVVGIDERGEMIPFDKFLCLCAKTVLAEEKTDLVTTVDAGLSIDWLAGQNSVRVYRSRVGDAFVADALRRSGALFGGEPSGSMIFPQISLCPDGPFAAAKLSSYISRQGKKVSELLSEFPTYHTLRAKLPCPNKKKKRLMKRLGSKIKGKIDSTDGYRIGLENAWVLLRPSGTEPSVRLTVEAENKKRAEELLFEYKKKVSVEVKKV